MDVPLGAVYLHGIAEYFGVLILIVMDVPLGVAQKKLMVLLNRS